MKNKTYKNFGDAFLELKEMFPSISYGKIARDLDITDSYAWNLPNRRRKSPIPKKYFIKLAKLFHIKPEYFFEYRLQNMLEFINKNRKFLNLIERAAKKYTSAEISEEELEEEPEEVREKKVM